MPLPDNIKSSPLYSPDLAPTPENKRTWSTFDLAAIWVGMAVCIPTYLLASYMIKSGVSWQMALIIIGTANLIITIPMVLNGHAGVKYGIPFPVVGRAPFGTMGIHLASVVRAVVACGWFGVQTWIGGLAVYAIWKAILGQPYDPVLDLEKFFGFGVFWLINLYFIWNGAESIKWLEKFAAPILIGMGIFLIVWGSQQAGGFSIVLQQGNQLQHASATLATQEDQIYLQLQPYTNPEGVSKATHFRLSYGSGNDSFETEWMEIVEGRLPLSEVIPEINYRGNNKEKVPFHIQFKSNTVHSSRVKLSWPGEDSGNEFGANFWGYLLWLTAMVGFWATMSLSIADITRYAKTQRSQVVGQFLGLPGTMILYSFVGIFVTFAAVVNFDDILISEDAPWDPVSFLAHFESATAVIVSQLFMLIATLSTNIAANVIAPANAFSNLWPQKISFRVGGLITAVIGIIICPWWLLDEISNLLIFVSGLLGPVLGILLADYFVIRKRTLVVSALYQVDGIYAYRSGFNPAALWALAIGVASALAGHWIPAISFLYNLSWFTGFLISFVLYILLMRRNTGRD
ncbi:MAG: hypothetical protein DHS20C17_29780 [Cyclobacteriaceae bacterium]|nr:MAG: hypothetical protein DHS20C17_29780 [Cyclobacteriaceae bacterium]